MEKSEKILSLEKTFTMDDETNSLLDEKIKNDDRIGTLFDFLTQEVLSLFDDTSKIAFVNAWTYLYELLKKEDVNTLNTLLDDLKKLQDRLIEVKSNFKLETDKNIKKVTYELDNMLAIISYRNIEDILSNGGNLKKMQKLFSLHPEYIHEKDENGISLYENIFHKYISIILSQEMKEKDLLYYNGILLIINEFSKMNKEEIDFYTKKIDYAIYQLDEEDKNYFRRLKLLKNMYHLVLNNLNQRGDSLDLCEKYNINIHFEDKIIEELKYYTGKREKGRRIRVKDYIITIDKENSMIIDDALTIKKLNNGNYLLAVHIADVLGYLPYHSTIVENAIRGGEDIRNVYHYDEINQKRRSSVITIFPPEFSCFEASFLQNKSTLANSYYFELDDNANIMDSYFLKTIIENNNKCSYNQVDRILKKGCKNKKLEKTIRLLDEVVYKLEENQSIVSYRNDSRAKIMVEIVAKFLNIELANYFYTNQYPILYSVYQKNNDFRENLEALKKINRQQKNPDLYDFDFFKVDESRCDITGFHKYLGDIPYCHGTSPLRRSEDIVVGHCLNVCYYKRPNDEDLCALEEDIIEKMDIINLQKQRISMFKSNRDDVDCHKMNKIKK